MCKIALATAPEATSARISDPLDRIVERTSQRLTHRGPDASGLRKTPAGRITLAHLRLAVADLIDAHMGSQPVSHAVGMFAFALWDAGNRVLHLARDRLGEKLIYLGELFSHLFFACESHAFRATPDFGPRLCGAAANAYLRDGCVPGALFASTYRLPPRHVVTVQAARDQRVPPGWPHSEDGSNLSKPGARSYWSCGDAAIRGREALIRDPEAAIERGEELIRHSVRAQIHADVPTEFLFREQDIVDQVASIIDVLALQSPRGR